LNVRFVEIVPGSTAGLAELAPGDLAQDAGHSNGAEPAEPAEPEVELELDEDFLRRIREV
jgi:hypothetical protein